MNNEHHLQIINNYLFHSRRRKLTIHDFIWLKLTVPRYKQSFGGNCDCFSIFLLCPQNDLLQQQQRVRGYLRTMKTMMLVCPRKIS